MFANYTEEGWEIITQRNHGLLAAEICARWKINDQPNRWVETLIACAGHDDAFNEFEQNKLITSLGGPINFGMGCFNEELTHLLINMALTKSSFIALLTLEHIKFTHGNDPEARSFLKKIAKKQKVWINAAKTSIAEIKQAYELLEFCDAFSILICRNLIQAEKRSMQISTGPDQKMYEVVFENNSLIVKPWPFEVDHFDVNYEVRKINQLKFEDDEEFRKALYHSIAEKITVQLVKEC